MGGEIREKFVKEEKNDRLTAGELYHNVDSLVNYDLVRLSACEVGCASAETITAEFVGISSVLLSKGVKSVISPLWAVREDLSALLMMELHRRIREEKENPHVALDNSIEYLKNMTRDDLVDRLEIIWYQAKEIKATNLQRKIHERKQYFSENFESDDKIFDHPYYLASFTHQGMVDSTERKSLN